ncbi:MAG: hypothetical protein ACRBBO_17055 [Cognatishimia sp.]
MSDQSPSPAPLSDGELRETLDMVGTVLASVSDRVDAQTNTMDRLVKTATEARQAAFSAQNQTDPEKYSEIMADAFDEHLAGRIAQFADLGALLQHQTYQTNAALKEAEKDRSEALRQVWEREGKADRLKNRLPWFGLGALVFALVLAVLLPRFSATNSTTCVVFGGEWVRTTDGHPACVYYQDRE